MWSFVTAIACHGVASLSPEYSLPLSRHTHMLGYSTKDRYSLLCIGQPRVNASYEHLWSFEELHYLEMNLIGAIFIKYQAISCENRCFECPSDSVMAIFCLELHISLSFGSLFIMSICWKWSLDLSCMSERTSECSPSFV